MEIVNNGYENKIYYNTQISSIAGKYKKFDQDLCDKFDLPARNIIKQVLKENISDNPNLYEQDMILHNCKSKTGSTKYAFLELQVCGEWVGDIFPRNFVYVYVRKARYGADTLFLTLSKDMERGYLFNRESFKFSKPVRYQKYSKFFIFQVPWENVKLVTIKDLNIDILNSL